MFERVIKISSCRWVWHVVFRRYRHGCRRGWTIAVLYIQLRNTVFQISDVVDGGLIGWLFKLTKGRGCLASKIANLCISPVQAGIMLFNTLNLSFIFDLQWRPIKVCTVLQAIFLSAVLVVEGCFFLFDVFAAHLVAGPLATWPSTLIGCFCFP